MSIVYSPEPVAQALLDMLGGDKYKDIVSTHYKVEDLTLETIATSRNWILKSGSPDTERTAAFVLKDFREGRIGKFILDELPS